ncbi:hypothetical protein AA103196_1581 [Ameyamaea chiangmaiensis NBRC 103196]|nr:hypothetical protein AA103196_1581 [Ameyamaea chiangmaiensis NBRC 103196]
MRKPAGRVERARAGLAGVVVLAGVIAACGVAQARPALVTLIDLSSLKDGPTIPSCAPALATLRDALDTVGIPTQRMSVPNADTLRLTLAQIGGQGGGERMIVVCGYAATSNDRLFVVPPDLPGGKADISRSGVSADTIARVAGSGSLAALELHPLPGGDVSDDVVGRWQAAADPATLRRASVDRNAGDATLLTHLTSALKGQGDAALSTFFGVQPQVEPPAPVVPASAVPAAAATATDVPHPGVALPAALDAQAKAHDGAAAPSPVAKTTVTAPGAPVSVVVPPQGAAASADAPADPRQNAAAVPMSGEPPKATVTTPASRAPVKPGHIVLPRHSETPKGDPQTRALQLGLLAAGVYHGTVTGKDNLATANAVRLYQKKLGHPTTGQLTPDEQKALTGG